MASSVLLLSSAAPCDHSFVKAQKKPRGPFEVKRGSRKHDIGGDSEDTLAEVPPWPMGRREAACDRLCRRPVCRPLAGSRGQPLAVEDDTAVVGGIQCGDALACHGRHMPVGFERHDKTTPKLAWAWRLSWTPWWEILCKWGNKGRIRKQRLWANVSSSIAPIVKRWH